MKKSTILLFFITIALLIPYISCKSTPKTEPAPVQKSVQDQTLLNDLKAAAEKAEESRKKAGDFDGNLYFPGEWETAEAQFTNAKSISTETDADVKKAIDTMNQAAASYDSIFELSVPLYAQAREDEIMTLRDGLIDSGARNTFPEYFPSADEIALQALDQYEQGDYYAAKNTAADALLRYETLDTAWDGWLSRWEINEREFILYDPDNYERGGEIISDAMDAYKADNIPLAKETAQDALVRYNLVLSAGWTEYSQQRAELAGNEKQAALETKTNIAARDIFTEADEVYNEALELQKAEKYEACSKQFVNAEALFVIASLSASEKRKLAADRIREANTKIEEADEAAKEAETIIYGGAE